MWSTCLVFMRLPTVIDAWQTDISLLLDPRQTAAAELTSSPFTGSPRADCP